MLERSSTTTTNTLRDATLQGLPDPVYVAVATGAPATLADRAQTARRLHAALLGGGVPRATELSWPAEPLRTSVLRWLASSGLPRYCKDHEDLATEVTRQLLEAGEGFESHHAGARQRIFEQLRDIEAQRLAEIANADGKPKTPDPDHIPPKVEAGLREQASARANEEVERETMATLDHTWAERLRGWAQIESVFGDLGGLCGLGWDLAGAVLKHTGWREIERLTDLLNRLPQITEIVRSLGRLQDADSSEAAPFLERLFGPVRRTPDEQVETDTPSTPHDTRGIERSGEIARMLSSEAILFTRPRLRLLWHARRAERTLATYRVRGTEWAGAQPADEGDDSGFGDRPGRGKDRGPIIVCLDTSGSMMGAPETIAKAITLEAVRTAHAERRDCYLYAFSGPGDVAELDLTYGKTGVASLLDFLARSFHGGTDVEGAVSQAIEKQATSNWQRADLIIVSDGEFPVPRRARDSVTHAQEEHGLRVHGLLVGAAGSKAMQSLCDPLHVFAQWEEIR